MKTKRIFLAVPPLFLALSAHAATQCQLVTSKTALQDDTSLLQESIDACAQSGGGTLNLPAKTYTITPIQLRSNVYLSLAAGTTLKGSTDKSKYVPAFIGWPFHAGEALISAANVSNAGIIGAGVIDGSGEAWWKDAITQRADGTMARTYPSIPDSNGMPRPWLVEFYQSTNVKIEGVTLKNSPMWVLALRYTKGATVSNFTVSNPSDSPNTDGIDVVSSQDIAISNVAIATGDDNIAIKSGLSGSDLPIIATSKVKVVDARMGTGHGLSIGSETRSGVNHIEMERISFRGTDNGIRIKTGRDRGADIGYIKVRDVTMDHVQMAFSVSAYYPNVPDQRDAAQPITATTPFIHDVSVENLQATAQSAGRFIGLPEAPLKNFLLQNINIQADTGLILRDASVEAKSLKLSVAKGESIKKLENVSFRQN